jgi:hypothetical protein
VFSWVEVFIVIEPSETLPSRVDVDAPVTQSQPPPKK